MASKSFRDFLAQADNTKLLDTAIKGNYLDVGTHEVTVKSIDTSEVADNSTLKVTFEDSEGRIHNQFVPLTSFEGDGWSWMISAMFSAFVGDKRELTPFFEAVRQDFGAWEVFTGFGCAVTLEYGKGYVIRVSGHETYAAFDSKDGTKLTDEYSSVAEARAAADGLGFKRAWPKVKTIRPTNLAANQEAFRRAMAERKSGGVIAQSFAPKVV